MAATRTQRPEDLGECIPFVFWHEGEGEDIADAGHERAELKKASAAGGGRYKDGGDG